MGTQHAAVLRSKKLTKIWGKVEPEEGGEPAQSLGAGSRVGEDERASVGRRTESTEQEESVTSGRGHAMLSGV